ncbi:adenosylcobinamide-GDP ribazoletransferase [Alkalibaculum sp. M08DMB]|uniref:Adenosylcobinamide-GDP ribazoletransferase n=1 Tax=Alkalibaculum sporogenes TaxID=2655001 RepID=A0A6A7KBK0_9FIRM|nr:adenosylcobinamide-GDP ribazoletransferase [Alkalibaculum sporogenes]MPW26930.1 adenosylcobinamide-GDP ribazoletransferase [Alkalibaculum sporogenes]
MKKFLVALSFFTRIPINIKSEVSEDEFYSSMALLPIIGFVIGSCLYGVGYLLGDINKEISAFLLVVFYIWITGGLHMDGFMDTLDGILSNRDRERVFEIMKDSRIGAFGAIGIILLIIGYLIAFKYSTAISILIMPIIGRSCALIATSLSEYAKDTNDMGRKFVESMGRKERVFSLLFTVGIIVLFDYIYLIPFAICLIITYVLLRWFRKQLSGMTGDTVGMMIELIQVIFLFGAYLTYSIGGF